MVVVLLMMSCHFSEKSNHGPLAPQTTIVARASTNIHGVPTATATASANLRKAAFMGALSCAH